MRSAPDGPPTLRRSGVWRGSPSCHISVRFTGGPATPCTPIGKGSTRTDTSAADRPLITGATNAGLADPGRTALISLMQTTVTLHAYAVEHEAVSLTDGFMLTFAVQALQTLQEAMEAFARAEDEIASRETALQEEAAGVWAHIQSAGSGDRRRSRGRPLSQRGRRLRYARVPTRAGPRQGRRGSVPSPPSGARVSALLSVVLEHGERDCGSAGSPLPLLLVSHLLLHVGVHHVP